MAADNACPRKAGVLGREETDDNRSEGSRVVGGDREEKLIHSANIYGVHIPKGGNCRVLIVSE